METIGPSLRRRQLAETLAQLRKQAGIPIAAVAQALGCTEGKVRHIEAARNIPTKPDLEVMLRIYGAPDRFDALEELRVAANERGWWATHRLPAWLASYVGLETDAVTIRCFALELVPGLIQTADYAREAFRRQGTPEADLDRSVAARMERQRRIGTEQELRVVMSEALLHRTAGMGPVGAGQLQWLTNATHIQGIELRVLPFSAGGHRSMSGSFTLLGFPAGTAAPVAYREGALHADLTDDHLAVAQLQEVFADLNTLTLSVEASAALIAHALEVPL
jgi:transcriptional regulator with XRE-family HTH domain